MNNLLKHNTNNAADYIRENISKDFSVTFDKSQMVIVVEKLNEGGLKLIAKMTSNDLDKQPFEQISWKYMADPSNENSYVNRKCRISDLGLDIADVIFNKRFDKEYLKTTTDSQ